MLRGVYPSNYVSAYLHRLWLTSKWKRGHLCERTTVRRDKEKESPPQMLKGLSKAAHPGQGYGTFGEPMPLMTYLNQHVPEWRIYRPL